MAGRSDLLQSLDAAIRHAAGAEGLDAAAAGRLSQRACARVQRDLGGGRHYVPAPNTSARDRAILAGVAAREPRAVIAARVGVSVSTVDRVRRRRRVQREGFAPDGWGL